MKVLPRDNALTLGYVQKGDSVKVLKKLDNWYHIEVNNLPGWLNSQYVLAFVQDSSEKKEPRVSPPREQAVAARPVQEKPPVPAPKPVDLPPMQPVAKKNADRAQPPRKPDGKTQVQPNRDLTKAQPIPEKKGRSPEMAKPADSVSTQNLSPNQAVSPPTQNLSPNKVPSTEDLSLGPNEPAAPHRRFGTIPIILGAVGFLALAFFALNRLRLFRKGRAQSREANSGMDALIVSDSPTTIFNSLTNTSMPITDFLSEMGLNVHLYSDLANAKTYLLHYLPEVLVIDWNLEQHVEKSIKSMLSASKTKLESKVIFYNVPNPTSHTTQEGARIQAHYLGLQPSDQELSKIVVPLFGLRRKRKGYSQSVQATALEGEIQNENLSEVLQFIEMGRKTGMLYIVVDSPFGLVYFEQGRILYAVTPDEQGKDAVLRMLNLPGGYFHFVMNKTSLNRNCNHSCLEIVTEWARILDETQRDNGDQEGRKKSRGRKTR